MKLFIKKLLTLLFELVCCLYSYMMLYYAHNLKSGTYLALAVMNTFKQYFICFVVLLIGVFPMVYILAKEFNTKLKGILSLLIRGVNLIYLMFTLGYIGFALLFLLWHGLVFFDVRFDKES